MKADYEAEVAADTPVGWWKLDETSGTTATNAGSGGSLNGTYTGGYTLDQAGPVSDCPSVALDGTTGYVSIPSSLTPATIGDYSLEVWFRRDVATADMIVFGKQNSSVREWHINTQSVTSTNFDHKNSGNQTVLSVTKTPHADSVANWVHVVCTYTHSTGVGRLYVNAGAVASAAKTGTLLGGSAAAALIGRRGIVGGELPFDGNVTQVAFYTSVLSAARVAAHYEAMLAEPGDEECDFYDAFSRADGNIEDSADWLLLSGNLDIIGGRVRAMQQAAGVYNVARTVDTFGLNHRAHALVDWTDLIAVPAVVARMSGTTSSNYAGYVFGYDRDDDEYVLRRRTGGNAGTATLVATFDAAVDPPTPFTLEIRAVSKRSGTVTDVECLVNGIRVICYTDLTPLTGESVGVLSSHIGDYYDDFCGSAWLLPPCGARSGWHVGDVAVG